MPPVGDSGQNKPLRNHRNVQLTALASPSKAPSCPPRATAALRSWLCSSDNSLTAETELVSAFEGSPERLSGSTRRKRTSETPLFLLNPSLSQSVLPARGAPSRDPQPSPPLPSCCSCGGAGAGGKSSGGSRRPPGFGLHSSPGSNPTAARPRTPPQPGLERHASPGRPRRQSRAEKRFSCSKWGEDDV